jgi:hypothetical protein
MGKGKDTAIWSEIGWAAAVLSALVVLYTIGIALASLDQLFGWLNTLLATMLSVFCALVIGLAARVALHNFGIWLNKRLGRPRLAFADLLGW